MASELSLTWDEHQSTLVGVFEKLLEAGALVDCTIAAEGQYLKAHKIILSACSPYFEMLFTEEKEKNPIVVLKDIKFQELRAMIDFIYRGKVKVPEERLGDFVDAAESLQIKGLGVGNRNLNSPELTPTESSAVTRKKEGRVSPVPRKRSRRSHGNNSGDNIRVISPSIEENTTTSSEDLQHQSQMDVPSTSQREVSSPVVSAPDVSSLYPSVECSEDVNVESNESITFAETSLPAQEQIPNPETVVVKREPEPIAEVYVPEIECYIEPKSEEVVLQESMLDCGSSDMDQAAGDSQHSSNQYSAFSSALQASTSTSAGRTDNLMLMADAGPSFSGQGAARRSRGQDPGSLPSSAESARGRKTRAKTTAGASFKSARRRVEVFVPEADSMAEDLLRMDSPSGNRMVSSQETPGSLLVRRDSNNSRTESAVDPLLLTHADMVKHFKTVLSEGVTDNTSQPSVCNSQTPTRADSSLTLTHAGSEPLCDRTRVDRSTDDRLNLVTNISTAKDQAKILSPTLVIPNASDDALAPIQRKTCSNYSKNKKRLRRILPRPTNIPLAVVRSFDPQCNQPLNDATDKTTSQPPVCTSQTSTADGSLTQSHSESHPLADTTCVNEPTEGVLSSSVNDFTATDDTMISNPNNDSNSVPNAVNDVLIPNNRDSSSNNTQNLQTRGTILPCPAPVSLAFVQSYDLRCYAPREGATDKISPQPLVCTSHTPPTTDSSLPRLCSESNPVINRSRVTRSTCDVLSSTVQNVNQSQIRIANSDSRVVPNIFKTSPRDSSIDNTKSQKRLRVILPRPSPISLAYFHSFPPLHTPREDATEKMNLQPPTSTSHTSISADISLTWSHTESAPLSDTRVNLPIDDGLSSSVTDTTATDPNNESNIIIHNTMDSTLISNSSDSPPNNPQHSKSKSTILPRPITRSLASVHSLEIQCNPPPEDSDDKISSQPAASTSYTPTSAGECTSISQSNMKSDPLADTTQVKRSIDDGDNSTAKDQVKILTPFEILPSALYSIVTPNPVPSSSNTNDSKTVMTSPSPPTSESPPLIVDEPMEPVCSDEGWLCATQQNPSSSSSTNLKPANSRTMPKLSKSELSPTKSTHRRLLSLACQDYEDEDWTLHEKKNETKKFKGAEKKKSPPAAKKHTKKRFPCPHCGWDFRTASKLKKHLRTHWRLFNSESVGKVVMMNRGHKND